MSNKTPKTTPSTNIIPYKDYVHNISTYYGRGEAAILITEPSEEILHNETQSVSITTTRSADSLGTRGEQDVFHININECQYTTVFRSSRRKGVIYGRSGGHSQPRCSDIKRSRTIALSDLNQQTFFFHDSLQNASLTLEFQIHFEAVEKNILYTLPIVFTSPTSGYVTSYGFEDGKQYPCGTNATRLITAPDNYVTMISFTKVHLDVRDFISPGSDVLSVYKINDTGSLVLLKEIYALQKSSPMVQTNIFLRLLKKSRMYGDGFKLLFTFHPSSLAPRRLDNGLWDCSVPHYNTFKQHLECNLEQECHEGQDEGSHCPYSSPACNGSVAVGRKCYVYIEKNKHCLMECDTPGVKSTVCEYDAQIDTIGSLSVSDIKISTFWNSTKILVVDCPSGHVTHLFLSCDPKTTCGAAGLPVYCRTEEGLVKAVETQMFPCDDNLDTLPYSLVCDFRKDCLDGSDENFCKHDSKCQEFTCNSGQCIAFNNFCDLYKDCWDGSDENCLDMYFYNYPNKVRLFPPAIVYFDGKGEFYQVPLEPSEPCPQTHFRCAGESAYCLPVYVRCNGVYDCPSHEDEEDCQRYTCPGFYRCRGSRVCVHLDNVCDGWPQCPQHDDELFCRLRCPDECLCQGFAFVCKQVFPAQNFPQLRYIDGTNSGMTLEIFFSNVYLVWIRLAFCGLTSIPSVYLPNLQTLDLSDNLIATLDLNSLEVLSNLKELHVAGNP
ncbi:hypothetical protein C0Q70_12337 [Pomacea canaliculata]|uniref:CUB domain-containing protein n=1 Tax=Pomacea canaliculata TaxID=400727 RepID=A0A2T7P191_POMCA|nr:hypothetical protein C0Q70_12337 [Pomacea canaliculata]